MLTGRCRWWGWGEEGKSYHIADPERFWGYLGARLGPLAPARRISSLEEIRLPPSRLPAQAERALRSAASGGVDVDAAVRAVFSMGKSYRDLVRVRRGEVPNPTDAVVRPASEKEVSAVLEVAQREGLSVIPFGGGTSVVGGVEPRPGAPAVTLDLALLSGVSRIDRESMTATVMPGTLGPELERQLAAAGLTLGHFPQSFEFSTVGGWIATRSSGQQSTLYGKIEEMVQGLRLACPGGVLTTPAVPAAAAGPDLTQVIAGSEGTLGVITEAVLRVSPLPEARDLRGYLVPGFEAGVAAAREIMQAGLRPAVLRLSDEAETAATLAMRAPAEGLAGLKERLGRWYLSRKGLILEQAAVMILGFEGAEADVRYQKAAAKAILRRGGAVSLGRGAGEAWRRGRYEAPYLRDLLLDHGVMVDTLETAVTWDRYLPVYRRVAGAIRDALGDSGMVMAHLSHAYRDGGSIYYTFLAAQERGREMEQWQRVKVAATRAIVEAGGALSHHHGIGADHRPWMAQYLGSSGARLLAAMKDALDPAGIMNPGKLVPELPGPENQVLG